MSRGLFPPTAILTLSLFATLALACGGGGSTDSEVARTTALSSTATAARHTPELTIGAVPEEDVATAPEATLEPLCGDPYPAGAPYEAAAGEPLRLQPSGAPGPIAPYGAAPPIGDPALEETIRIALGENEGRVSVYVKNLADGRGAALAPDRVYYAASLFKTFVMLEAYHQREAGLLDFGETFIVSVYYAGLSLNPGEPGICDEIFASDAIRRMMSVSDNVSANLMLDRVGSGNVNAALAGLGLVRSQIPADGSLPATASDMGLLMEAIANGGAVSPGASSEMLDLLFSEAFGDRLPLFLPPGTGVAHKTGNWANATHDAGIVFSPGATYVMVVLSDFGYGEDGASVIAQLSLAVYDYYNGA